MLHNQAMDNTTIPTLTNHMEAFHLIRNLMAQIIRKLTILTSTTNSQINRHISNSLTQSMEEITRNNMHNLHSSLSLNIELTGHNLISLTQIVHMLKNLCRLTINPITNLRHPKDSKIEFLLNLLKIQPIYIVIYNLLFYS